ncbi:ATP-binding protein [Flavobacterium silvaticum]|uniref:histidine kinase n=1 Tax=Flavobacterium silvaticum TaxID=1852020 RepID=A0A972FT03_9FLAO|nr:ATP-binding protein [Flavobacterium silvaticum]NMH26990.1 GAF domain-containing protein [Flavobacterium silvaticum]
MMRDIVNRDLVNLDNCENEPIHIPGSIQPHGFLLAFDTAFTIVFASSNIETYLSIEPGKILGKKFSAVFGESIERNLQLYSEGLSETDLAPFKVNLDGNPFECTVHHNGSFLILEAEPEAVSDSESLNFYRQTTGFLANMSDSFTLRDLCQHVANTTREITGYDRVMIYRFDKDNNGEVFAESHIEGIEPFLGLHYPHTDIPRQARELYLQNLLRLIVDMDYTPVPILTLADSATNKSLDLSLSVLRSTSPIHVQYLQNMGVEATLTVSLIHKGKLWGLIACHHYSALNLSPQKRIAAKLQGQFLTSQIDVRQLNEEYDLARKCNSDVETLNALPLVPKAESIAQIIVQPELLSLCNAGGVSICFGNELYTNGDVPNAEMIRKLSKALFQKSNGSGFTTDRILTDLPELDFDCEKISGLNYQSLGLAENYNIIWYRPETISEVHWAGDPSKAIEKDTNGLSPRKSFELWQEFVKCQSLPWRTPELNAAANYGHALQRHMNLILLSEEGKRNLELNETLKEANSELENINWISTHDLQEPLRKIQLMASRLLSKEEEQLSKGVVQSLMRMNDSAGRMQALLIDILKYTRIRHTKAIEERVDLNVLLQSVEADVQDHRNERMLHITIKELPVIMGIPFLINQLFSNLFSNSIKYSKTEGAISIEVWADEKPVGFPDLPKSENLYHLIHYKDNGIGFEPQFSESIFNIFTRLHGQSEYKGSGVGLALCKKIMQTHKGHIKATGKLGEGAEFFLYFPV